MLNYGGLGLGLIFTAKDMATTTMRNVDRELRSVSDTADAASRRFESSMRLMRTGLASLGIGAAMAGSLALVGKAAFDTSAQFKQITKTFEVFLGSAEKATQHVEELQKFAETTPFEFLDLTQYSRQLQAYGFQVQEIIPMLTAAGDAAAAMQDPMALERLIRALGQVRAKGRLVGEELRQIAEIGLPVYQILQEQLGLTAEQVSRIADQGVPAQRAIEAIMTGLTERYGGMMAELMKTPQGILSNMQDMLARIRRGIGDVFYNEVVAVLRNALDTLTALGAEGVMKGIGEGFRGVVAVVKPMVDTVFAVVRAVAKLIEQRPWIASLAVTFAGVSAVVLMVAGSFMFLRGIVGTLPMLLQKIGMSGRCAIGSLVWPVLAVSAAIVGFRMLVERNIGGIGTLWRGVATLIANTKFDPQTGWVSALPETLRNELKKLNLLDLAVKIWMFTVRAREFLQGFVEGVRGFVKGVGDALRPIGAAFLDVARAVVAPFVRAGLDLTKTASGLPIKSFRDFGIQVGQAFERALPYIRGFALGVAGFVRVAGAVMAPVVRVVVAVLQALGKVVAWVAGLFARSGREVPTEQVSALGKVVGALVAAFLALKAATAARMIVSVGVRGAEQLVGAARTARMFVGGDLPTRIRMFGAELKYLTLRLREFRPERAFAGLRNVPKLFSGAFTGAVTYFRRFGENVRFAAAQVGQFVLAISRAIVRTVAFGARLLWTGIRAVATFVGGLVKSAVAAVSSFVPAISSAAASAWAFASALLANPITWIIAGVLALGAAVYLLWRNWDRVTAALGRAWAKIRELATGLSPVAAKALSVFMPFIGIPFLIVRNWGKIKAFFAVLWRGIVAGASGFVSWVRGLPGWFAGLPGRVGAALSRLRAIVPGFFRNLWASVAEGARGFWAWVQAMPDWFAGLPGRVATALSGLWTTIVNFFTSLPERAAEWGRNFISSFVEGLKSNALVKAVTGVADTIKSFLGFGSPTEAGPGRTADLWAPRFVEMFAQGLRKGLPLVTAASVELASALSGALAGAVPALSAPVAPAMLPPVSAVEAAIPHEMPAVAAAPVRPQPSMPAAPPIRPVVVQVPVERPVGSAIGPARGRPQPEVIQLVVDGRVLAEVVRNVEREDWARSAPW
ncbi:MAG: tape measure protein [Bacillota bacterium]